jgi:hypothetical protein
MTARYCGASLCNSVRHPLSATSMLSTPLLYSIARVRSATADPHASGHASNGLSLAGAARKLLLIIVSSEESIGSNFVLLRITGVFDSSIAARPRTGTERCKENCPTTSRIAMLRGGLCHTFEVYIHLPLWQLGQIGCRQGLDKNFPQSLSTPECDRRRRSFLRATSSRS